MNERATTPQTGPNGHAAALLSRFEDAGYARAEPAILQPAEPFLDLSGEDIRRRMYLTTDAGGHEFCLRPDLTIPVARHYLASPQAGGAAGFSYLGPVFRYRGGAPAEFWQAGIELFGRRDIAAADAEMLALGVEATAHYGLAAPEIRMGDVGLFAALIAAVDLPAAWKRRLVKDFNRAESLEQDLDRLVIDATTSAEYQGVLAALAGADRKAAHALVTDLLSIAGISAVGGRSVAEIAERLLDQAALGSNKRLPREIRTLIGSFLTVTGNPDEAAGALRALAANAGLDLDAALDLFESRTGFLAARGFDVARMRFSTGFGRGVDYYTGFVFELHDPLHPGRHLVAGGRYDGMLSRLDGATALPAVGFAVWIERLMALGGAS